MTSSFSPLIPAKAGTQAGLWAGAQVSRSCSTTKDTKVTKGAPSARR